MEYLEGETLAVRLRRERVALDQVLTWASQVASALELAHARGIVHRDLKPANLFVTASGAIKVLDFGLAKTAQVAPESIIATAAMTDVGTAVGTIAYMSPEQARGEAVDARSDVFSFGAVLYEAVTGRAAFGGSTTAIIFDAILNRPVRSLRDEADVPADLATIVDRMLAKRIADRYPHGGAVGAAMREFSARRDATRTSGASPARVPSIAVLPFADMSAQKDQDYFCEGMAEELISALSKLSGLRVASRTSTFRFKGAADIHTIGAELGVETVVEGSVRTAGSRLRVTAQLTNVADGYQIWSERYDRQLADVFDIQDEVARAIVDALKVKLLGDAQAPIVKRYTDNVEAYQLCLKARYYWYRWTADAFDKAMELFGEALKLDPKYALALFGLGDCYTAAGGSGVFSTEALREGERLFHAALAIDPNLAEAHAILGVIHGMCHDWDWDRADREIRRALELNPRSAHVQCVYGMHLMVRGDIEEGVKTCWHAVTLDPLVPSWNVFLSWALYAARRYDEALDRARTTLELEPTYHWAHVFAGLSLLGLGDTAGAVAAIERGVEYSGGLPYAVGYLGLALGRADRRTDAERQLADLLARPPQRVLPQTAVASVYLGLGDREAAFAWLERAVAERDPQAAFCIGAYPVFQELHGDPRYVDLKRRMGLA